MRKQSYIPPERPEARQRERAAIRRPITAPEVAPLEVFGAALRIARKSAGLTQWELSRRAGFEYKFVYRLEAAVRRPRLSSLEALCAVIVDRVPNLGPAERLRDELTELAGPGLAPESMYRRRVETRRVVRWANQDKGAQRTQRIFDQVMEAHRQRVQAEIHAQRAAKAARSTS